MGKFISVPIPMYDFVSDMANPLVAGAASASVPGKLSYGTGGFASAVSVGDIVLDTDVWVTSVVTKVDSDTLLTIAGAGNVTLEVTGANFKIWSPADAYSLTYASGLFLSNVRAGDFVLNEDTGLHAKVVSVVSDTEVMIDNLIFDDNGTDKAVMISQNGFGCILVNLKDIMMPIPTAGGGGTTPLSIEYKESVNAKTLNFTINEAQVDYCYSNAFLDLAIKTMESEWTHVVNEMPLINSPAFGKGGISPVLYCENIVLA